MDIHDIVRRLLGRAPEPEDGISEDELALAGQRLGAAIPSALLALYRHVGGNSMLMDSFNSFVRPENLRIEEDRMVFLEENQGVCSWAVDMDADAPKVFMRPAGSGEWLPEAALDEFLPAALYLQCAQMGYEFAGTIGLDDDTLKKRLDAEWETAVRHNGFFAAWKPDCLLWYLFDGDGEIIDDMVYFSARTPEAYATWESEYELAEL